MKIAVYTCITGGYDTLMRYTPQRFSNIDFICFTDDMTIEPNGWSLRPIPDDLKGIPQKKIQRLIKICPHRYLKEYDVSLWVDGNIQVTCDVISFIKPYLCDKNVFFTRKHPSRKCIFQEAKAVLKLKKDTEENINPQLSKYLKEGFPKNFGMVESCIIIRKHNDPKCIMLDNFWAKEILTGSHRDQLSFNYCLWKLGCEIGYINLPNLTRSKDFRWKRHG